MRILLDTQALLWFHSQDPKLSGDKRRMLESGEHECWYSIVSLWEIAIKHSIGKLELVDGLEETFNTMGQANLRLLDLERPHILQLATLPMHHRDPFDRILIAQGMREEMHILTSDVFFEAIWPAVDHGLTMRAEPGLMDTDAGPLALPS